MKKILIVGAGFLQNFVICKAKSMGYETLAIDGNPNAIGLKNAHKFSVIDITNQEACLSYAKSEKIDGVLTAATDYGVLTASYIAQQLNLPGLNYSVAKIVKNKFQVRKILFENKIDDTEQSYEIVPTTNLENILPNLKLPVMVKPCDGSGSRGATRVDFSEDFMNACKIAIDSSFTKKAIVETFIEGKEYGSESIVINGEVHVLSIIRKWMTRPPYYAELGHAIPTDLSTSIEERAKSCVMNAIKALGINFGSVNMDMIITPEGKIHIIDIGARMGGNMIGASIIPYGTGIDYMAQMIKNAVGDIVDDLTPSYKQSVATKILAFNQGIIKQLPDFRTLEKKYNVEIYHHMEIGQQVNEYHTNLDGCGYIISKAKTIDEAIANANTVFEIIQKSIF